MSRANEPSFPQTDRQFHFASGLTKRELFAAMAMAGLLANESREASFSGFAKDAIHFADALIAEFEKAAP